MRAFLIGAILIPLNCFWVQACLALGQGLSTTVSLFFNAVFVVLILRLLNPLLGRFSLKPGEILTVYVMVSIASGIAGVDMVDILVLIIPHFTWFSTPENDWQNLFGRYVPGWFIVKDKEALEGYYGGSSTLYTEKHILAWLPPIITWTVFISILTFVMLCVCLLMRRRWVEIEKLNYPIIQLPLEMTKGDFLRNRILWTGFAVAAGVDLVNGLHFLYPPIPSLGGQLYDLLKIFNTKPWNAIGLTWFGVYPFVVGLSYFMPLDLSFSCWFFFMVWKAEKVLGAALGLSYLPGFPFVDEQSYASYFTLGLIALWMARGHIKTFLLKALGGDRSEPVSSRVVLAGLLLGFLLLLAFCRAAGMELWVALLFFSLYFIFSISITKIRAELGAPIHDLHWAGTDRMMTEALGTSRFNPQSLVILSFLYFINRAYRSHPMPHQLEAFKIAERTGINVKRLSLAIVFSSVFGTLCAFWGILHVFYRYGAVDTFFGWEPFGRLQNWLHYPSGANFPALGGMIAGSLITLLLAFMRRRFLWWPFHPVGFAVSSSWLMSWFWFSVMLSWSIKYALLRFGGLRAARKANPFFLGVILGEFTMGSIWSIIGIAFEREMYKFLY